MDSIFNNCARDCCKKYFHTFKLRCIYDNEMTNGDFLTGIISDKKLKRIVRENGFIHKLVRNFYSRLSKVIIRCYLKFQIPMCHSQLVRIISRNPEFVKTHCNDLNNPFHFACRRRMINQ